MDEPQQPRVFLSYARADRPRVAKLAAALVAAGMRVWWDTAIEGGSAFAKDIARELDAADVVVVVWSATSVESAWVLDEAGAGRDRKRLVPVQLDATLPPLGFRQLQAVDLSGWRGRAGDPKLAALVAAITRVAGNAPRTHAAKPPPGSKSAWRFAPWLVAALILAAALGAGWHVLGAKFGATAKPIVAVLPFTDMSEAKGKAYFAEGLAEEILDTLAHDARLTVLGGTTARAIRDNSANPDFARDKLGVTRLLEGSVRGGGDAESVKVSVRLIDTSNGSEIWSQAFDRSGADVVAVQEEVAQAVAAQLAGPLGGTSQVAAASTAKVPPAAYEKVLVAKQLLRSRENDAIAQARVLTSQAIALAPDYAPAYAIRAQATALATLYYGLPVSALPAARRDAETAIRLDPALSDGYTGLGWVLASMNDRPAAIAAFTRAVALKPDNSDARFMLGLQYTYTGQINRAIAELEKAVVSDPLWIKPAQNLADAHAQAGQFAKLRQTVKHYREMTPNPADADTLDSSAASVLGEYARALSLANAALARNPKLAPAAQVQGYALMGMLATERFGAANWLAYPPFFRSALAGRWAATAAMIQANGPALWDDPNQVALLSLALLQQNLPADVVRAFDARFANVGAYLASPAAEEFSALYLAAAFDRAGRPADAQALRNFARARMTRAEANGTAPSYNASNWALLLLSEGDRAGALAKLEAGVNAAWWQGCGGFPWIGDVLWFAPLHGDPRFEAVKGRCRAEINKQRNLAGIAPADLK